MIIIIFTPFVNRVDAPVTLTHNQVLVVKAPEMREPAFGHVTHDLDGFLLDLCPLFLEDLELFVVFGEAYLFFRIPERNSFLI